MVSKIKSIFLKNQKYFSKNILKTFMLPKTNNIFRKNFLKKIYGRENE